MEPGAGPLLGGDDSWGQVARAALGLATPAALRLVLLLGNETRLRCWSCVGNVSSRLRAFGPPRAPQPQTLGAQCSLRRRLRPLLPFASPARVTPRERLVLVLAVIDQLTNRLIA